MVQAESWSSVQNGELLRRTVAAAYAVFVTPDRKLEYQQHIPRVGLAVVVLRAHTIASRTSHRSCLPCCRRSPDCERETSRMSLSNNRLQLTAVLGCARCARVI